ncbi:Outer membrane protein assembly factor BamB [Rubripirellula obstinata]|uniref:Outer membrane protein assembly factor BamB n=2 Tax=Rubripirellula obstinata TaxID=406547 RepID=A0A5B1CS14_9BACT|nr:Outer membrane protein assembly factor BamB [Rubripirellula obstinata]
MAQGFFRPPTNSPAGRLIEPPRAMQQKLREAESAIKEDRPSDAILALGDLVARDSEDYADSDLADQDFFLDNQDVREGNPATQSLLRTAREMIGGLSESDWETYQLRFGPIAARVLNKASESRDWNAVAEVRRRYLHTLAGYEATALLAQREIYRGHPLAASILLDEIAQIPRAVKHLGPSIVLMHAATRYDSAKNSSDKTIPDIENSPVKDLFFNKELSGEDDDSSDRSLKFASMEQLKTWLDNRSKDVAGYQTPLPKNHPMFGSSADRNGNSAGQMPLSNMRWALPTTASHLQEKMVREFTGDLATSGRLPPPSWMPLRVGDQLLMRTTERLVGVDYTTGKRVWTYPWQSGWEPSEDEGILFDELSADEETDERISGRIWNDVPYGQVTSDGDRVFMLTDLADIKMASFNRTLMFGGTRPADNRTNTLVALEMETEGKLLWRLGQNGDPTSPLAEAFFLGPPLPLDGRLYVLAEIAGDILLCCLDPANGNQLWRQHLVAIESGGIDSDALRRVSGAMPTFHEGMLICPTGAGACVAIHLIDRTLAWGAVYDRSNDMMRVNNRGRGLEPTKLMQRWDNGVAVGSGSRILITPPETERLLGFDLLTGKPLFQYKNRVNMKYLAGIRDDKFVLVSSNEVRAYELTTGNLIWSSPQDFVAAGQHVAGRGVFGKDDYIVPTTTNELIRVSLKDGSVLQRRSTRYPLGNMVAVEGDIIVQSPTMLAVAFGEKTLEPIVDRRLAENPDDFDALVRKSELLIQKGQRREALDMLRRAREQQSDNDEVHMLSVSAMLGMLRDNPEMGEDYTDELDDLIDRPAQRVELLSLRLRGAMKQEQWVKATEQALALSDLLLSDDSAEGLAKDVINDPTRSCSLDCWLATRMSEMLASTDASQQSKINDLIRESAKDQINKPNQICARWIRHFHPWEGVSDARGALADRYLESKQWLAAERLLLGTNTVDSMRNEKELAEDSPMRSRLIDLAKVYLDGRMPEDTIGVLTGLSGSDDLEKMDLEKIKELRSAAESRILSYQWPDSVSLEWTSRNLGNRIGQSNKRTSETKVLAGQHFVGWQLTNQGRAPLAMRNTMGLSRIISMEGVQGVESRDNEAVISGGTMLVTMSTGLVCVDLFRMLAGDASVLWRHAWGGDGDGVANRSLLQTPFGDQVYRRKFSTRVAAPADQIPELAVGPVVGDRCFVLQGGDLIALDILSGEILWRNSDAPKNGEVVSDGQLVAVVSDAAKRVDFFNIGDGQQQNSTAWNHGKLWTSAGRHVLSYDVNLQNRIYQTKLVDPFTDQVLLEQQSTGIYRNKAKVPLAYGKIVNGRYLCSMQSDGKALVWDIASGKEVAKLELPEYQDLQGLSAIHLKDQFILAPKRKLVRTNRTALEREVATTSGKDHQTVHGVFAINESDGALRWSEEFDSPWGCTLNQAYASPLLMLTRSPYINSVSTRVRKKYMDILALDVNDGANLKERLGKDISPGNNQLQTETIVQPARNQVLVKIGEAEQLIFKFGVTEEDKIEQSGEDEDGRDRQTNEIQRQLEMQLQIPRP